MHTLDLQRPGMPDLQFTLLVTALCTSRLNTLNIPHELRAKVFDRCWVLIHDSPPPRRPNERVLDLRPWTEVTLDAMVETIRTVFTEAGIHILTWDHAPSAPTQHSTPEAQALIDRFEQLYPQPSPASDRFSAEALPQTDGHGASLDVPQLVEQIALLMTLFSEALEQRAANLMAHSDDPAGGSQLQKGAEALRHSGAMYLTWARHYAALPEGTSEVADEEDLH